MLKTFLGIGSIILTAAEVILIVKAKKIADEAMAERIKKYGFTDSDENEIEAEGTVILIMEEP